MLSRVFLRLAAGIQYTCTHIEPHAAGGRYATGRKSQKILPFFVWRTHVCFVLMRLRECLFGCPSFASGVLKLAFFFTGKYASKPLVWFYRANKFTRESSGFKAGNPSKFMGRDCRSEKMFFCGAFRLHREQFGYLNWL